MHRQHRRGHQCSLTMLFNTVNYVPRWTNTKSDQNRILFSNLKQPTNRTNSTSLLSPVPISCSFQKPWDKNQVGSDKNKVVYSFVQWGRCWSISALDWHVEGTAQPQNCSRAYLNFSTRFTNHPLLGQLYPLGIEFDCKNVHCFVYLVY